MLIFGQTWPIKRLSGFSGGLTSSQNSDWFPSYWRSEFFRSQFVL